MNNCSNSYIQLKETGFLMFEQNNG